MAKKEPKYYSTSQVSCYRSCKQKWDFQYRQKLQTRAPQRPLYMGTTIHKLLEIRANGGDWHKHLVEVVKPEFDKMPTSYQANLGEDFIECCDKIMRQYDWVWSDEQIKYLATEVKIDAKIKGYKRFVGIVDAICELDGKQYVMEHKTFKTKKMSMEQTWFNQQTCLYIKILNQKGYHIEGVIWDMVKTQAYDPPKVLKDGSFGKQYSSQTVMSFRDAKVEEIPQHIYEDIKTNHLNFVDRYITPVLPSVVESVWEDYVETVDEIAKNKSTARNLSRDCENCPFKDLCQAELTGGDIEYVKQLNYTTPEQREKEKFEEFRKTEACQKCFTQYNPDPQMCMEHCELYKKFKEEQNK